MANTSTTEKTLEDYAQAISEQLPVQCHAEVVNICRGREAIRVLHGGSDIYLLVSDVPGRFIVSNRDGYASDPSERNIYLVKRITGFKPVKSGGKIILNLPSR